MYRYNRYNLALYDRTSGSWKKVDVYGNHSQLSTNSAWDVNEGWAYRKNGRGASTTFTADDWNIEKTEFTFIGGTSTNGNDIVANSYPLFKFSGPSEFQGNIIGTINQRRGMITGTTEEEGYVMLDAEVPLSEMFGYSTTLRSNTQGKAEFTMEFAKYAPVPNSVADELMKEHQEAKQK